MKKRITAIILITGILLVFTPIMANTSINPTTPQFYITIANLHLRAAPSISAESLGVVPRGTGVQLVSRYSNDWFRVTVANILTTRHEWIYLQTGYMAAEFLAPIDYQVRFTGGVSWLIEPTWDFDAVFPFHEGMAGVEIFEDEWGLIHILGYINNRGEIVIPIQYRHRQEHYSYSGAPPFAYGRVILWSEDNSSVAVFDNYGNIVVPFEFTNGWGFSEGLAAVQTGEWPERSWGFIDLDGNVVIDFQFDPFVYEFRPAHNPRFSEGLAAVYRALDREADWWQRGSWGFVNREGQLVVPFTYDYARDFREGRAAVIMGEWEWSHEALMGFIDPAGNEVIPLIYNWAEDFSEGLAAVSAHYRLYGHHDGFVESFLDGNGNVVSIVPNFGFIDRHGNQVITPSFVRAHSFSEGLAAVQTGGRTGPTWGFIDRRGNEIVPPRYNYVRDFSEGMAAVFYGDWRTGLWGFVDRQGNEAVPLIYYQVRNFSHGLAAVQLGDWETGLWGFIDHQGNEVVPVQFEAAHSFSEGLAWVRQDGLWGIIQIGGQGIPIAPMAPVYDYPANYTEHTETSTKTVIRGIIQRLTPAERNSENALVIAAQHIEAAQRRASSQPLPTDGIINAQLLGYGAEIAEELRQFAIRAFSEENIPLPGMLQSNINFITHETETFSVTFPDGVQGIFFDNVTIEADFAVVTINRHGISAHDAITVSLLQYVGTDAAIATPSMPLTIITNFWSVAVILVLVIAAEALSRRGKKLPLWVVPAIAALAIAANAGTFLWQGGAPAMAVEDNINETTIDVAMSPGARLMLSLPAEGIANPENLILFNEQGASLNSRFNPVTGMIDTYLTESGIFILGERSD